MGWLRKAALRSGGVLARHDELGVYDAETAALSAQSGAPRTLQWIAGIAAFKAVLLEGLEVIFIVDVARELFKMFVADLRLSLATLGGVALVAALRQADLVGSLAAGALLLAICIAVLVEAVIREARRSA